MKLRILYLYPELLNLYGDRGNIEILYRRAERRGISVDVKEVKFGKTLSKKDFDESNFVFMGGGSDLNQKILFEDMLLNKKGFLSDYVLTGKTGLFICGAYQLLGNYYQTSDGNKIPGLEILNFHTINYGPNKRSVGKTKIQLSSDFKDTLFKKKSDKFVYGFSNHGGHTFFDEKYKSLGKVKYGFGNNLKSNEEGIVFQNTIGTYLHGPVLSLNPALCDYLIKKSLKIQELQVLNDSLIEEARHYLYRN